MNYEKQKLELIERERAGEEISFEYLILESKGTNLSLKKMEEIEEEWRKRGLRITRSQNENKFSRVGFENDLFDLERVNERFFVEKERIEGEKEQIG